MFQTNIVQKNETHILYSICSFEISAVYEMMWRRCVEYSRPRMTIMHMRIECWVPTTNITLSEYVIFYCF